MEQINAVEEAASTALYAPVFASGRDILDASDRLMNGAQVLHHDDHAFLRGDELDVRTRNGKAFDCGDHGDRSSHEVHQATKPRPSRSGRLGYRRTAFACGLDEEAGPELHRHVLQLPDATFARPFPLAFVNVEYKQATRKMTEAQRRLG